MLNKLSTLRAQGVSEEGFTLIELIIVVVIIGILAAIAIPIFMNQQKSALAAGVKSDVRNTNTNIATAMAKTPTASVVGGATTAVAITKAAPHFYVGTPATGVTPVTAGAAAEGANANIKGVVSDANTSISIRGDWDNYTVVGSNTGLGAVATNAYTFTSTAGTSAGIGELA